MPSFLSDEGIVLSAVDVGEEDRILTFLTREHGLWRAGATSAKNLKKGRTASLDLFVRSRLEVSVPRDSARLKRVRSAEALETFLGIRSDYARLCAASYVAELVTRCVQEDDPVEEIFHLVSLVFGMLEKGGGNYRTLLIFEGRFLKELGMAPDIYTCRKCGGQLEKNVRIAPDQGGFFHEECFPGVGESVLSPGDINNLRYILEKPIEFLPRLGVKEERAKAVFGELRRFSLHHLGFSPKTGRNLP